jgi:hypothetical protein
MVSGVPNPQSLATRSLPPLHDDDLSRVREQLGPDVRTCAWDYPGVGHSSGDPMLSAARAAS